LEDIKEEILSLDINTVTYGGVDETQWNKENAYQKINLFVLKLGLSKIVSFY
jgi:hypothetical protein